MAIEFHCGNCNKLLRTTDDKAGRRARCPECGDSVVVPGLEPDRTVPPPPAELTDFEERADESAPEVTCPMCGAAVLRTRKSCPDCGEELRMDFVAGTTFAAGNAIAMGSVLDLAWRAFLRQPGMTLLGGLVVFGLPATVIFGVALLTPDSPFEAFDVDAGRRRGALFGLWAVNPLLSFAIPLVALLLGNWLILGASRFALRIVRGRPVSILELLNAESRYGLALFNAFILCVCLAAFNLVVGIVLHVVKAHSGGGAPFVYAAVDLAISVPFLCFYFVIVDRTVEGLGPLRQSQVAASGNYGTLLVLALLIVVLNVVGTLALIVGLIFTIPLSLLILASAYEQMTTVTTRLPDPVRSSAETTV